MRYNAGISGEEYGAMEDGYEQGYRAGKKAVLRIFHQIFSGGPDTGCRTTWREGDWIRIPDMKTPSVECVEVPMEELRAAFDRSEL